MTAPAVRAVGAADLAQAVSNLDAWLETMHREGRYGGPIAHWWESSLVYAGPQYDWRYEGLIDGYGRLWQLTTEARYLERAMRAADAAVADQLPDGRFPRSSFQFGPVPGGTPHEAAVDASLLQLAALVRDRDPGRSAAYVASASRNLLEYWLAALWDGRGFRDQPYNPVHVANKHGTVLEALLAHQRATGHDWSPQIDACRRVIQACQQTSGPQEGGIVHAGIGPSRLAVGVYTARAMNGLLTYRAASGHRIHDTALLRAGAFLTRLITAQGVQWGIYGDGRPARNPLMVAGAGDVLRFFELMEAAGLGGWDTVTVQRTLVAALIEGQLPSGGIMTAWGFSRAGLAGHAGAAELRDVLPVVGWADKAFRSLVALLRPQAVMPPPLVRDYEIPVRWQGRIHTLRETRTTLSVHRQGQLVYLWCKATPSVEVYAL